MTEQTDDAFSTLTAILLALMTVYSSLLTYHTLHTVESQKDAKQLEACAECQKGNRLPRTELNATAIPTYRQGRVGVGVGVGGGVCVYVRVCVCVHDAGLRNCKSFSSCVQNVTQDEGKEAVPVPAPDFWGLDLAKGPHSLHVLSLLLHAVHHFS